MRNFLMLLMIAATFGLTTVSSYAADWSVEKWKVFNLTDDFTDETTVYTAINADSTGKNYIIVQCTGSDYFEFKIKSSTYSSGEYKAGNFMFRIDKKPVQTLYLKNTKYLLYGNTTDHAFIQALLSGGKELLVKVTGYDNDTSTMRFTLNGAAEAVAQVIKACYRHVG